MWYSVNGIMLNAMCPVLCQAFYIFHLNQSLRFRLRNCEVEIATRKQNLGISQTTHELLWVGLKLVSKN